MIIKQIFRNRQCIIKQKHSKSRSGVSIEYFLVLVASCFLTICLSAQSFEQQFIEIQSKITRSVQFTTQSFQKPRGGHLQGVQQLSDRHLVVSGSSRTFAYFFIVEWEEKISDKNQGKIISFKKINDDFPSMLHKHAGGIQLLGNVLAVGTEGGKDPVMSSVVFYDLNDPRNPKPLFHKIDRTHDTAGAIGITRMQNNTVVLAVGGWDSKLIDFYTNDKFPEGSFTKAKSLIPTNRRGEWGAYQNINLVADQNALYLAGFCQEGGANLMDLHRVDLNAGSKEQLLTFIARKPMVCGSRFSFRYGSGISLFSKKASVWVIPRNWRRTISVGWFH